MPFREKAFILVFLALINALGSGALAIYVDQRFIWLAILIPAVCGVLLLTLKGEWEKNGKKRDIP